MDNPSANLANVAIDRELYERVKASARSAGQTVRGFTALALEIELRRRVGVDPADAATSQKLNAT